MDKYVRNYILHGLRATPDVLEHLMRDATEADYDRRPDPDRFTLREVIAHLADWEGVWLERATRMVTEDRPSLPSYDEGQWAIDHNYSALEVAGQLAKFRDGRAGFAAYLNDLGPEQWDRVGVREFGPISVAQQCALVIGHDGYHLKQVCDWLKADA